MARPALVALALVAALTFVPRSPARAVVLSAGRPADQARPSGHLIAYVRSRVALLAHPGGRVVERLSSRTSYGSPQTLAVVRSRYGRWLAVSTPELGNGRLAWVDARVGGLRFARTRLELDVDLSQRLVVLRRGSQVLRRLVVGVGRPGSPTPTGRFSVTDKLSGPAYSAYYGCCILALSARSPHAIQGWNGGNRIAIHSTPEVSSIGEAVSHGCLRLTLAEGRWLLGHVPLGTPTLISA